MKHYRTDKIIILADIHSNDIALQEVLGDIEKQGFEDSNIIVNGDVVSLGPNPEKCFELLERFNNISFILGNNDRYIINRNFENVDNFHADMYQQVPQGLRDNLTWTFKTISAKNIELMKKWPKQKILDINNSIISVSHGTPDDDEENIYGDVPEQELIDRFNQFDVYVFSHTHIPFVKQAGGRLFLNPGSVGSSLDGDQRASYAVLTRDNNHWEAQINRVAYDLNQVVDEMNSRQVPWRESILKILLKASF